ncbi:MAG: cold-shock protein [Candidatus Deferrimicrobium sp.]|nr:cold-shock protein [Candidatus Deferrimicrobium sp.]MDO8738323.1 cold-shock protein [Candidatus Deferrimicrobium sp.]
MRSFGTVKWFNAEKGFGFITPDSGGEDVFLHSTVARAGKCGILEQGDKVSFEAEQGPKGQQAVSVSREIV